MACSSQHSTPEHHLTDQLLPVSIMESGFEDTVLDFSVMLWNTHSSDSLNGQKRKTNEKKLAFRHVIRSTKRATCTPLFLLCQERICDWKHKLICEELDHNTKLIPHNGEEANIYYINLSDDEVNYIHTGEDVGRQLWEEADNTVGMKEFMKPPVGSGEGSSSVEAKPSKWGTTEAYGITVDTLLKRLHACVFHARTGKVLIISWHGPHLNEKTVKNPAQTVNKETESTSAKPNKNEGRMSLENKAAVFRTVVCFAEVLRERNVCDMAVIGGDFNFSSKDAKTWLDTVKIRAKVFDEYKQPKDRRHATENIPDFIIVLRRDDLNYEVVETSVHHQYYKREKPRMYDHPLVRFRLIINKEEEGGEGEEGEEEEGEEEGQESVGGESERTVEQATAIKEEEGGEGGGQEAEEEGVGGAEEEEGVGGAEEEEEEGNVGGESEGKEEQATAIKEEEDDDDDDDDESEGEEEEKERKMEEKEEKENTQRQQ